MHTRTLVIATALAASLAPAAGAWAMPNGSHDPAGIAFSGGPVAGASQTPQIYEMTRDGAVRQLTHDRRGLVAAAWSPDGSRLAAFRFESPRATALYIVHEDGSLGRRLASAVDGEPSWSPDGRRIAYKRDHVIVVERTSGPGGRLIIHTGLPSTVGTDVTWSPDGSQIAFVGAIRGQQGLFTATIPADGGPIGTHLLLSLPGRASPARPRGRRPARRSPTTVGASGWYAPMERTRGVSRGRATRRSGRRTARTSRSSPDTGTRS